MLFIPAFIRNDLNCLKLFKFFLILFILLGVDNRAFAVCPIPTPPTNTIVRTVHVPPATSFRMPFGGDTGNLGDIDLLSNSDTFNEFNYPIIRFNENGNNMPDDNEWYVATAHNQDRWLNNSWNSEPSPATPDLDQTCGQNPDLSSKYSCNGDHHPGEDWNRIPIEGNGSIDEGEELYAIADGIVLFSGLNPSLNNGYGYTTIIIHKVLVSGSVNTYEYITSFYAHMQNQIQPLFKKGDAVCRGDLIGNIGTTGGVAPHLHFEIRKGPIVTERLTGEISINSSGLITINSTTSEICLAEHAAMWPAANHDNNGDRGQQFIANNYYDPSIFLKQHNTLPPTTSIIFHPSLQGRTIVNDIFSVSIFTPGTQIEIFSFSTRTEPFTGFFFLPPQAPFSTLSNSTFDLHIHAPGYLASKMTDIILSTNTPISLSQLRAGDLNNDNIINSLDWSIMNPYWFTCNTVVDINRDGLVNSIDFGLMNSNWGRSGD